MIIDTGSRWCFPVTRLVTQCPSGGPFEYCSTDWYTFWYHHAHRVDQKVDGLLVE